MSELRATLTAALNEVLDPCSIGRGVSAGLVDMGLVLHVGLEPSPTCVGQQDVALTLRTTGPGCTFMLHFDQQVRARLALLDEVAAVDIEWAPDFDWSDDDIDPDVRRRLRERRDRVHRVGLGAGPGPGSRVPQP